MRERYAVNQPGHERHRSDVYRRRRHHLDCIEADPNYRAGRWRALSTEDALFKWRVFSNFGGRSPCPMLEVISALRLVAIRLACSVTTTI